MPKVGLIGPKSYTDRLVVERTILELRKHNNTDLQIYSGGNREGAEFFSKKAAIEAGLTYKEFNPAYTTKNLYSVMSDSYYSKPYHGSHPLHRYSLLIRSVDFLIMFIDLHLYKKSLMETVYKMAIKRGKEVFIIFK